MAGLWSNGNSPNSNEAPAVSVFSTRRRGEFDHLPDGDALYHRGFVPPPGSGMTLTSTKIAIIGAGQAAPHCSDLSIRFRT